MTPNQPIDIIYDEDDAPCVVIPDLDPDELHIAASLWWEANAQI